MVAANSSKFKWKMLVIKDLVDTLKAIKSIADFKDHFEKKQNICENR